MDVFHSELVKGAAFSEKHEFPILEPTYFLPERAIPFDKASKAKDHKQWVHFYIDDYRFERLWNNPKQYLPMLQRFDGVITPDYSIYKDMPVVMQTWNTYRNRAMAFWLQKNGVPIVPNICWNDERSFDFCFEGLSQGCSVAISSNGCLRTEENRQLFKKGLTAMVEILRPNAIINYGSASNDIWNPYKERIENIVVIEHYNITLRRKAVA